MNTKAETRELEAQAEVVRSKYNPRWQEELARHRAELRRHVDSRKVKNALKGG